MISGQQTLASIDRALNEAHAKIDAVEGKIEAVFFFVDPLGKHPHDPDIQTLLRICNVHDVPLATNAATASYIISEKAL